MKRLICVFVAVAGLAAADSTSPIAQEMTGPYIGSLDCRFSGKPAPIAQHVMRCTLFHSPPYLRAALRFHRALAPPGA
jgi:hypothetical protein